MSKLDEMRNQFRERLTIRSVPHNRITVLKVESDSNNNFNTNYKGNDSNFAVNGMTTSRNTNTFQTKSIPKIGENYVKKSPIIRSKVSDSTNANKPISRLSVQPKTKSPINTTAKRELTPFKSNISKTSTKINQNIINNNSNSEFKPKVNLNKEIENKKQRMTSLPAKDMYNSCKDRMSGARKAGTGTSLDFAIGATTGTPCRFCGRFFAISERLQKHESICNSSVSNSRQKFDSVQQRFKGQPNEYLRIYENALNNPYEEEKKGWNWRQKHEYCLAAIRSARGDPTDGPTTSEIMASTQQQCDYCKRRFSDEAIKRHLPICAKLYHKKVINH